MTQSAKFGRTRIFPKNFDGQYQENAETCSNQNYIGRKSNDHLVESYGKYLEKCVHFARTRSETSESTRTCSLTLMVNIKKTFQSFRTKLISMDRPLIDEHNQKKSIQKNVYVFKESAKKED